MYDLYLIVHKVRGEPAFDIAERMVCPECGGNCDEGECKECDDFGYWWIIPTSGHRAYPYGWDSLMVEDVTIPPDWPDHYPPRHEPTAPRIDILSLLAPAPKGPTIRRRL